MSTVKGKSMSNNTASRPSVDSRISAGKGKAASKPKTPGKPKKSAKKDNKAGKKTKSPGKNSDDKKGTKKGKKGGEKKKKEVKKDKKTKKTDKKKTDTKKKDKKADKKPKKDKKKAEGKKDDELSVSDLSPKPDEKKNAPVPRFQDGTMEANTLDSVIKKSAEPLKVDKASAENSNMALASKEKVDPAKEPAFPSEEEADEKSFSGCEGLDPTICSCRLPPPENPTKYYVLAVVLFVIYLLAMGGLIFVALKYRQLKKDHREAVEKLKTLGGSP